MSEQNPDIICQNIDNIISRTNDCHEVRDYILWYLYSKYFDNDLIYIHLSDNYFSKLEINNLTENIRNEIIKRADVLRKITIGSLAPIFTYIDDNSNHVDLAEIESKNIVLFFYKPDCQKCIREKRILELVNKRQKNLTILHINISEDNYSNVSQDIINQYYITTTPTIYVLDKEKRIIAKNIKAEEIEFHIIKK
jgi:thiol-disulfide isomerase/thioredoxin